MTLYGWQHNAAFEESRLTPRKCLDAGISWVRTLTYPDKHDAVIESANELFGEAGTKTILVLTTEGAGCELNELDKYLQALDDVLTRANGAFHAVELQNELDDPRLGITNEQIISVGLQGAAVVHSHPGVLALAPSLLSGPEEGRFEVIAGALNGSVDAMTLHPYYCSLGGVPNTPQHRENFPENVRSNRWRFGAVEEKADICQSLAPAGMMTWITELGCPTVFDEIGPIVQAQFSISARAFNHPAVPVLIQFCWSDSLVPDGEIQEGKDWGLVGQNDEEKQAFIALSSPPLPVA